MLHFGIKNFRLVHPRYGEIKLSHTWLNNQRFCGLSERQKGILLCLMLAAARSNNRLPGDVIKLARLLGTESLQDQDLLHLGQLDFLEWISEDQETPAKPKRLYISDDLKAEIIARQGGRCHHCRRALDTKTEFDHYPTPVSKGGETISSNLVAAHQRCNRRRGNRAVRTL